MGRFVRKLQTLLALPSSKRVTRHLSFSRLPKLESSESSPGFLRRVSSSRQPSSSTRSKCTAPKGRLPIRIVNACTSDGLLYFIKAEQLNHPLIAELLHQAAEEYGYSRAGILELTCDGDTLEDILSILSSP
ncbi:hypothetical protein KP509_23G026200 [Ceratopteris richardii]|uniref:Uncharacterized protein n=1 Tax=Ceratopteris richardii TaxID=49495 RepID=A0A8T2RZZ6_CERRI|nr:hypothetical protein KP509_23G026200 [Ceratopteris richardii]